MRWTGKWTAWRKSRRKARRRAQLLSMSSPPRWWCGGSLTWLRLVPSETTTTECNLLTASCLWGVGSVLCECVPGALYWRAPRVPSGLGDRYYKGGRLMPSPRVVYRALSIFTYNPVQSIEGVFYRPPLCRQILGVVFPSSTKPSAIDASHRAGPGGNFDFCFLPHLAMVLPS